MDVREKKTNVQCIGIGALTPLYSYSRKEIREKISIKRKKNIEQNDIGVTVTLTILFFLPIFSFLRKSNLCSLVQFVACVFTSVSVLHCKTASIGWCIFYCFSSRRVKLPISIGVRFVLFHMIAKHRVNLYKSCSSDPLYGYSWLDIIGSNSFSLSLSFSLSDCLSVPIDCVCVTVYFWFALKISLKLQISDESITSSHYI